MARKYFGNIVVQSKDDLEDFRSFAHVQETAVRGGVVQYKAQGRPYGGVLEVVDLPGIKMHVLVLVQHLAFLFFPFFNDHSHNSSQYVDPF